MSDEDYERYLAYELTAEGQAEIAEAAAERQAKAALAAASAEGGEPHVHSHEEL
ncbi:Hypothetical protein, putative [Bodo saltans]|uniref:Uncharacterized protein n=1 Tax=Bodo saltans TaxID=75058 RepID=A0A0S4IN56_BODSA|nr:Hypothetical protein, putative [Bodo saltans]|eukprot:CUE55374.1 Hypothetical protein, putative [Bodo saltans]